MYRETQEMKMTLHHPAALLATIFFFVGLQTNIYADATGANPQPAAVQVFPEHRAEQNWGVEQFWPMNKAYGWKIADLPHGQYRLVVRVAHQKLQAPTISASEARKQFISKGKGLVIDSSVDMGKPLSGFLAFQLIDLNDLGFENPKPLQLRLSFSVKNYNGDVRGLTLPVVSISGKYVGFSPDSEPRWQNGEMHLKKITCK
jgi:hypothetical protein